MADSPRTDTVERGAPDTEFWASPEHPDRPPVFPPRPGEWGGPLERFVDRVRELRGDPRVGVAALVVVALAAGFIWYRLGAGDAASSSTTRRAPATSASVAGSSTASGSGGGSADPSGLVNLNSATQAELEALPGIGPSLAGAIVTERERRGGFRSVNELRDVRGIGEKRFADLKDKVTI